MKIIEQLRSVFLSVTANKFRVILTSLGIIIGSFTIVMVVGIGKAGEASVAEQYKRLSVESINISRTRTPGTVRRFLTKSDVDIMPELLANVQAVGISVSANSSIVSGSFSKIVPVLGVNEEYAYITNLSLEFGDFFTNEDATARNRYVALGSNLAREIFDEENLEFAVGEVIRIKGMSFTVTGILDRVGGTGGISGGSVDDMALIPYEVAIKYTAGTSTGITSYIALANSIYAVADAIEEIQAYIAEVCGSSAAYTVSDVGSTLTAALETSNTMSTLLIAVAAIVLVVSGIGIMNVMMVAVSERTREIGILKSLGAKRRTILSVFLFEAFIISIIGGLLGISLSIYAPAVLSYFSIDFIPTPDGLLLGLGFSVFTGIFFGYYPALKASKLKPIDALNKE